MSKRTALAIFALALLTGCTAATRASMGALGSDLGNGETAHEMYIANPKFEVPHD